MHISPLQTSWSVFNSSAFDCSILCIACSLCRLNCCAAAATFFVSPITLHHITSQAIADRSVVERIFEFCAIARVLKIDDQPGGAMESLSAMRERIRQHVIDRCALDVRVQVHKRAFGVIFMMSACVCTHIFTSSPACVPRFHIEADDPHLEQFLDQNCVDEESCHRVMAQYGLIDGEGDGSGSDSDEDY